MEKQDTLGSMTSRYRKLLKIESRELAKRAGVYGSLISGIQNGARTIGERNAGQIGKALGLEGNELTRYVYLALNGSVERVFIENQKYPAEILNFLPFALHGAGIHPENVQLCTLQQDKATLHLNDGSKALVEVKITKI